MTHPRNDLDDIFIGSSAMAAAMKAYDWSATSLGLPEFWPAELKTSLRLMLTTRFEMWVGWGQDLLFFYNDAYTPTLGAKHPNALGLPMRQVWSEVSSVLEGRLRTVMHQGVATWDSALMLLLERNGSTEESYHSFSYNPLRGDTGAIEGLICFVTEETSRIISERRLATLQTLATSLLSARERSEVLRSASEALKRNQHDFPFSALYLFERPGAKPVAFSEADHLLDVDWPFRPLLEGGESVVVPLAGLVRDPPTGAWDRPPRDALLVPISNGGQDFSSVVLVLGLNPFRPYDPDTRNFARLLAGQIAGALASVDARQQERAEAERLRELFEQSPSFTAILRGPDHRFEQVNSAYSRLFGDRDLVGKTVRDAFPDIADQNYFALLDKVYATGEPYVGQSEPFSVIDARRLCGIRDLSILSISRSGTETGRLPAYLSTASMSPRPTTP